MRAGLNPACSRPCIGFKLRSQTSPRNGSGVFIPQKAQRECPWACGPPKWMKTRFARVVESKVWDASSTERRAPPIGSGASPRATRPVVVEWMFQACTTSCRLRMCCRPRSVLRRVPFCAVFLGRNSVRHSCFPPIAIAQFLLPGLCIGFQCGEIRICSPQELLPAIALNGTVQDRLHGLPLIFGHLAKQLMGSRADANVGSAGCRLHKFYRTAP